MCVSAPGSFARIASQSLSVLLLAGCSNEAPPSGGAGTNAGGAASAGGISAAGSGGSSAGLAGTGGGLGGMAGSSAGSGGAGGARAGAGSGGASGASGASGSAGSAGASGNSGFSLTSPNLSEGSAFADKYTCAAAGFNASLSPELAWTSGPSGTQSYAITFIDVTLTQGSPPSDLGYHWVIYDIPATTLGLPEEFMDAASIGAKQSGAYLGPCPNFSSGSETHTYEFKIYALETATLSITPTTGTDAVKDAEAKLEASHLAVAKLSGMSDASPP